MSTKHRSRWRFCVGLGAGLFVQGWLAGADRVVPAAPPAAVAPADARVLTLPECLKIAFEHQPNIAAAQASLASAETNLRALEQLHVSSLLPGGRELPIRRQQASLAVCIAHSALQQAEFETVSAVERTYVTVLYARAQRKVADDLVTYLQSYYDVAGGKKEERGFQLIYKKIAVFLRQAQARRAEAVTGIDRATAALREAMGVGPEVCFQVAEDPLFAQPPALNAPPCLGDLVQLALARRGEVAQAATAVDVFHLEVDAQAKNCLLPTARTFASGGDIHARGVPPHIEDGTLYRPGALAPEMPPVLVGSKCFRVERAQDLAQRAGSMADKTRNLVALDVEEAYHRLREAQEKLKVHNGAQDAIELEKQVAEDFRADAAKVDEVAFNQVVASRAKADYNEAVFQYLLSLVALERATAGGFASGLGGVPAPLPHCPEAAAVK